MRNGRPVLEKFESTGTRFRGWRVRLPGGRAVPTPAVVRGRVFVGGGFGSHEFYAFDAVTGEPLWQRHTSDDGPTAAVAWDDVVAYNTESCTLEVVRAANGEVLWSRWLGDPLLAQPALGGGRVFMVYPKAGGHRLGAFGLRDGKELWELPLGHDVITAPVFADGRLYLATFDGAVSCIDPDTARVRWTRQMQATSAPWVYRGEVYVSQRDDETRATSPEPPAGPGPRPRSRPRPHATPSAVPHERTGRFDGAEGSARAAFAAKPAPYLAAAWGAERKLDYLLHDSAVGFGNAPAAAKLEMVEKLVGEVRVSRAWRFQGSRPVVVDGVLYDTTGDLLEATEVDGGKVLWSWRDASAVEGERRLTPPAVAGGRVLAGTWDGRVLCWDAATGALLWQAGVGAPCHWQPAMAGGWIFAGLEDGSLVAFDTGDPAHHGWTMWGGGPGHNGLR